MNGGTDPAEYDFEVPDCYDVLYFACESAYRALKKILEDPSEELIEKMRGTWKGELRLKIAPRVKGQKRGD